MKHLWKAAVLFIGLTAAMYGTKDVWPGANFKTDVATIRRSTISQQASSV